MNQKNGNLPNDAGNMPIKQSLMSRFDLVFEFENLRDKEGNAAIARHILDRLDKDDEASEWNHERLQMHIEIAKEIRVEITEDATEILKKYFIFCRDCTEIEQCRKTYRLWTSLNNLTACHAKLMLRSKAGIDDAVAVVMLMESTWTFGNLLRLPSVVQSKVPVGPSRATTATILDKLDLCELLEKKLSHGMLNRQESSEDAPIDKTIVDDIFGDDEEENEPKDEIISTQDIFSTQINNFTAKSSLLSSLQSPSTKKPNKLSCDTTNIPIKSPKFTSAQLNPKLTPERMDEETSPEDKLYAQLNSMFSAKPVEKLFELPKKDFVKHSLTISPRKTTSNISPSSFQSKLKKFKHSNDFSQNTEKVPEKIPEIENKSPPTVAATRTLQDMEREVEEMDFFDF